MSHENVDAVMSSSETPNILLITVDSCRFDTAQRARTPVLDALGPLRRAVTPGTFTLPAHMAFFSGYLPNVREWPLDDYYSREGRQLWRLSRAKAKSRGSYWLHLEGDTLWEGLRKSGYYLVGAGGVRWFLTSTLTREFDEFLFRGPNDYLDWFRRRVLTDFIMEHPGEIVQAVKRAGSRPWFLFVNCLETHVPYDVGTDSQDPRVRDVIARAEPIWAGRRRHELATGMSQADWNILRVAQIQALEAIDARLGRLMDDLPGPFVVVVTGDHGECLGEDGLWGHGFPAGPVVHVPMWVGGRGA